MSDNETVTTEDGVAVETEDHAKQSIEQPTEQVVEQQPEEAQPETEADRRAQKMEAIAERRMQQMVPPDETSELDEKPVQSEEEQAPDDELITLKVNGSEKQVSADELRKLAQKGLAADEKFQAAATERKSADQRIKELEEKLAQLSSASPSTDATKQALPKDEPVEITPDVFDRAVFGEEDERVRLQTEMARRLNQTTDPTEIKRQIRAEMRIEDAVKSVSDSDPIAAQILSDEAMKATANRYSAMLLELEPGLSEVENIARACQQASTHYPNLKKPEPKPQMQPARQVAQTKKAHSAGNMSVPAQRTSVGAEPPTEAQMRLQAKAEQRRARGLI